MNIKCSYDKLVNIEDLKKHPKNPNKHDKKQIERIAKNIRYTGIRHPIIVSKLSGLIVVGHGRLEAARLLKLDSFPVNFQDFESEEEEYAFMVSDNALHSEFAELDLKMINDEIKNLGPDFDIDFLGMKDFTIDFSDKFDESKEDDVPEVEEEPTIKLGDLIELGKHRLLCGDCTIKENVDKLMIGKKADIVFTDPPYNVGYEGNSFSHGKLKTGKPDWIGGIKNDNINNLCFENLIKKAYELIEYILNEGSCIYICYPSGREGFIFINNWLENWHFQSMLIWEKSHLLISRWDYHPIYEPILYGWKNGNKHNFYGERNQSNILKHKSAQRQNESGLHPTQKPISLIQQIINNSSKNNDILFEPFSGSGSTLIACEKTNRICYGMEIDPHYCDVIIERYLRYTNQTKYKLNGEEKEWTFKPQK